MTKCVIIHLEKQSKKLLNISIETFNHLVIKTLLQK